MVPSQDDPTAQMKEEFPFLHALSGGGVDLSGEPPSLGEGPGGERETLAVDIVNISDMKPIGNPNGSVPSPSSEPAAGPETTCQSRDDVIKSLLDALPPSMSQRHTETALNATCQVEDWCVMDIDPDLSLHVVLLLVHSFLRSLTLWS